MKKDKDMLLRELSLKRKKDLLTEFPDGYGKVGDYFPELDELNLISPWTKTARNVDSQLMIVGQDWSSSEGMNKIKEELGYDPANRTNINLHALLKEHFQLAFEDIYATNLFVFIKPGSMSASIPTRLLDYCAVNYTSKEIEIVSPKLVICLGSVTYARLTKSLTGRPKDRKKSIQSPYKHLNSYIVGVPHTGVLGTNNAGGILKVNGIWRNVRELMEQIQ